MHLFHRVRFGGVALLALVAFGLLACTDDEDPVGGPDDEIPTNLIEVLIGDDGLDPNRVEVRTPDRYQLVVGNNSSEDCTFHLGHYVRDLEVPAGQEVEIEFQVPPDEPNEDLIMGCEDGERVGEVSVLTATAVDGP